MQTMMQLNPPIPVDTPKGKGLSHVLIDYGPEYHTLWLVALDDSREIWTFPNYEIRIRENPTMGRMVVQSRDALGSQKSL